MKAFSWILLLIVAVLATHLRFNVRGHHLPEGCDEFGFLHMSEAISDSRLFDQHTPRAFEKELIAHLMSEGFGYHEYAWAIAPHAYHVDRNTEKIINQYTPGTSALLSLIPKRFRQVDFAGFMMLLMLLIPGLTFIFTQKDKEARGRLMLLLCCFGVFAITSDPMLTEFGRINSVAPTFGMLLAAGVLMRKNSAWALVLIGLSTVVRLPNVLLFPPVLLYSMLQDQNFRLSLWKAYIKRGLKGGALFVMGGFGLYLAYAWILLGNPLAPTYSEIDQRVITMDMVADNVHYYISEGLGWLLMNVIAVMGAVFLWLRGKISNQLMLSLALMPMIIYVFFVFHFIRTSYYPYAPSLVIFGLILSVLAEFLPIGRKTGTALFLVATAIFVIIGGNSLLNVNEKQSSLDEQVRQYQAAFAPYDVVWGDLRSSTFEYSTGKPGMRLNWGQPKAVLEAITWLQAHGYAQVILLSDLNPEDQKVQQVLTGLKDNSEEVHDDYFGRMLEITD